MSESLAWSRRRPTATVATVVVAALVLARYGIGAAGFIAAFAAATLVVLSVVDLEERRLPNVIVLPAAAVVLGARLATQPQHWLLWVLAALVPALGLLVLAFLYPAGLGMGDVKLALLIGATLGRDVLPGLILGSLLAAVVAAALLVRHGAAARRRSLPYGPFLAFGTLVMLVVGAPGT